MKKAVMFVFTLALCSATLFAQGPSYVSKAPRSYSVPTPLADAPAGLQKIFSNLGSSTSAYSSGGWIVRGPNAQGGAQFIAMPFTPKANSTVTQVRAAVEYASGAKQVNLSLYADNNGSPGTLLAGPVRVTNLPTYFSCCKVAVANFSAGVAVTAGTQYWVVSDTPSSGTGSDFNGVWEWVPPSKSLVGASNGGGWGSFHAAIQEPAGAVYGTIP